MKIITISSFSRGVGKSNIAANLTALLADTGQRIAIIDINIPSPSLHFLFGLDETNTTYTLNDYLHGKCSIIQTVYDITLPTTKAGGQKVFLIPAIGQELEITQMLRKGYDPSLLSLGILELVDDLNPDILVIDTQPGLSEETLLAMALCDAMVILLHADKRDYEGTGITIRMARELEVPQIRLIANEVPKAVDYEALKLELSQTYGCDVAAVLPHLDEMMALASAEIFALRYPNHPLTAALKQVALGLANKPDLGSGSYK